MAKSRNRKINTNTVDAITVALRSRGNPLEHFPTKLPSEEKAFGHIAPYINPRGMDGKTTTLPNPDKYFAHFPTLSDLPREVFEPFPVAVQKTMSALTHKNSKESKTARR